MAIEGYGRNIETMAGEVIEESLTNEEKNSFLRINEKDALAQLMEAANYINDENEYQPIEIVRNKKTILKFTIRPLSEEEFNQCRKASTKYVKNRQLGITVSDATDVPSYHQRLIYKATVEEDQKNLWDNKAAWKQLDVVSGYQVIGKVLKGGEIDSVINKLNEISGYTDLETVAKN